MKWFMQMWAGASDAVKLGLLAGLLVLAGVLVYFLGENGLQALGGFLGAN